ncbi:MAG: NAD-binding protein [Proteobacteria bacterium]|nr:NAD-binding protein [Pseudomonadota bacterium]
MYVILSRVAKRLYARISGLSWDIVLIMTVSHFMVSWGLIALVGGEKVASGEIFWYFYATTATTVGYGDYSPVTEAGQVVTILWIMPGGIALFTTIIAKVVQQVSDKWRKRLRGSASYENLTDHIVILGWHGSRTQRMVDHIRGGQGEHEREIVLCSAAAIENPMPDQVRFVRGTALNTPDLLHRAAVAKAKYIIALGHDDNETLAAALGAAAVNGDSHIVAYFDQQNFADLLKAHCPHAECNVSLSIEMMVRSAQDPGSSRVQRQLLSTLEGPTQFSLRVPADANPVTYGALFSELKTKHDATLFGVAESALGDDLILNAPSEHRVDPGMILYFMAAQRIEPAQIDWDALGAQ